MKLVNNTVFAAFILFVVCTSATKSSEDVYDIGVGIADVTGPAAQINMMGYAHLEQTTTGIHLRLHSRAFLFGDQNGRFVFVSVDAGSISQLVHMQVIKKLKELYGEMYTESNVCLSSTHTHSGPGGFFQYLLYDITSLGYIRESADALVTGIVRSIQRAHDSVQKGYIYYDKGDLYDASINRSPASYLQNPLEERARYAYNVDKEMFLLKLTDTNEKPIGMINWFAVHGVSMNNTNTLISSDNKGYASILFENKMEPGALPGKTKFVAAFAQSNEGDVSPNIKGALCVDSGEPCDFNTSTCHGVPDLCRGYGPGKDMFESTSIIAHRQADKAWELFEKANIRIQGPIKFVHQYVNMTLKPVFINETTTVHTCKAALGHSFAAGTTDGYGAFDFQQNTRAGCESTFWDTVRNLIKEPSKSLVECHHPKAVLLATGELNLPYEWTPSIVSTQLLQLGQLVIAAVPGEFTTMSGRRLRDGIHKAITTTAETVPEDLQVVIAGLSNIYTNYITTYEEYQFQRYEGGSTMYGPHTLEAYIEQYIMLAISLAAGQEVKPGPSPPDLSNVQISLMPGVFMDTTPIGFKFGSVYRDAEQQYTKGETVKVYFACGNPRNSLQLEGTFLTVERFDDISGNWSIVATDSNWETRFQWKSINSLLGQSLCTVQWEIPVTATGKFRIRHIGHSKSIMGSISQYEGVSQEFIVV